eukprot:SAG31_NODE_629_length_13436_cov_116.287825_13_plen_218_part_00
MSMKKSTNHAGQVMHCRVAGRKSVTQALTLHRVNRWLDELTMRLAHCTAPCVDSGTNHLVWRSWTALDIRSEQSFGLPICLFPTPSRYHCPSGCCLCVHSNELLLLLQMYHMTRFAASLNHETEDLRMALPPTDSRWELNADSVLDLYEGRRLHFLNCDLLFLQTAPRSEAAGASTVRLRRFRKKADGNKTKGNAAAATVSKHAAQTAVVYFRTWYD